MVCPDVQAVDNRTRGSILSARAVHRKSATRNPAAALCSKMVIDYATRDATQRRGVLQECAVKECKRAKPTAERVTCRPFMDAEQEALIASFEVDAMLAETRRRAEDEAQMDELLLELEGVSLPASETWLPPIAPRGVSATRHRLASTNGRVCLPRI